MREAEIASYDLFIYIYICRERERDKDISFTFIFRNGQLDIADQIICIHDIYLNLYDSIVASHTHQLLVDSRRLSIELIIIRTTDTIDYFHAAVSSSNNNGHSCISILSTPFNVDMVVRIMIDRHMHIYK
jgi:hypothetical protein